MRGIVMGVAAVLLAACRGSSQAIPPTAAAAAQQAPPPATKLEGFKPAAGTVITLGYDDLGNVAGIAVDVREFRDPKGASVRGLLVDVSESQYREERSFVDADEIPELLKGIDALLAVQSNPTAFKMFEVRYTTKGSLQLTAFNNSAGAISYSVRAGRITTAQQFIKADGLQKLRVMFVAAQTKLAGMGGN